MTGSSWDIGIKECSQELPVWRRRVLAEAREMGFSESDAMDIALAVFEACANAVHHGSKSGDDDGHVTLCIRPYDDRLEAVIQDCGDGLTCPVPDQMPPPTSNRGRGIPLMKAVMDEVKFELSGGCKVTLTKYLKGKHPAHPESTN